MLLGLLRGVLLCWLLFLHALSWLGLLLGLVAVIQAGAAKFPLAFFCPAYACPCLAFGFFLGSTALFFWGGGFRGLLYGKAADWLSAAGGDLRDCAALCLSRSRGAHKT